MAVELTEAFFSNAAGWDAMKRARGYLAQDQVLSSDWSPPLLKGVVQAGGTSYRAGLVIKNSIDIDNVCTCRESREWGKICAHSVGVGLHWIRAQQAQMAAASVPAASGSRASRAGSPSANGQNTSPNSVSGKTPSKCLQRGNASAEALELFLILPPNFEQALARGKLTVFFEGQWRAGRSPLSALPKEQPFYLQPADATILDRIEELAGETPAILMLETSDFAALLPLLAGHPRVTLGKTNPIEISRAPWSPEIQATLLENGEIELRALPGTVVPGTRFENWVYHDRTLQPAALTGSWAGVLEKPVKIPRPQIPTFLSQDWPKLLAGGNVEANFQLEDFTLEPQAPKISLHLTGGLALLHATLQCQYGLRVIPLGQRESSVRPEDLWLPEPNVPTRYATRDFAAESAAVSRLTRAGFLGPDAQGRWQMSGQDKVFNFFARDYPKVRREWTVTMEERLDRSTAQNIERIEPQFQITPSGVQWFDLGVVFASSSGEKFSAADIQRLVLSGQSHARLKNGKTAVIDTGAVEELQEVLLDCAPQQHARGYRLDNTQTGFLATTLQQRPEWKVEAPAQWRQRAEKQSGAVQLDCPPLGPLEGVLRPYQKAGVAWLHFLRENQFGGILADEMGLGKTLQVLALLAATRANAHTSSVESRRPWLVICPTSLVFNWMAEAAKFTPQLKTLALHGAQRSELFARIPDSDLVVTSYALIRRDAERYRDLEFDTVVLDEAQHIKNRQSQNAQAVKSITARHRLVLTGTPMENSVLDLWSIFDFLMPGYLGPATDFRERYELPILRDKDVGTQTRLARRLRPFLLRRLKRDVAPELPEKIEQVAWCELTSDQRTAYQQLIEATRKEVFEAVGAQGFARSRMVVLSALLRLRQVCCDLRLLKLEGVETASASAKMDLFDELLDEVIDGGHRALVFSQFTSVLALLRERLETAQTPFCYLDGSTINRGEVVARFQRDASIPVFLISLKAGGVGLNLTGADTVIHFDPWWNPAVEDQATGRAHRLGQSRVVTSYKLIARDTIEEKILKLQERKRELFKAMVEGEGQLAESLTWEEVQELLA